MPRIIYLSPFTKGAISGGIKADYRHVELLTELGYDAYVWQPDGHPTWLVSEARLLDDFSADTVKADDIVVFPEVLEIDPILPFVTSGKRFTRLLFCQNQYYIFNKLIPTISYEILGFQDVFCSSLSSKACIEDLFDMKNVSVIPYYIDPAVFVPKPKKMQIAMVTRKMRSQAGFISKAFRLKYRDERELPFVEIDNRSEQELADILGESAIVLALSYRESFGLVPVEAMSAGCLVVGFHGHGGLDYARPENGLWFGLDDEEQVIHALYKSVKGLRENASWTQDMINAGTHVAAQYNRAATKEALAKYFASLGIFP